MSLITQDGIRDLTSTIQVVRVKFHGICWVLVAIATFDEPYEIPLAKPEVAGTSIRCQCHKIARDLRYGTRSARYVRIGGGGTSSADRRPWNRISWVLLCAKLISCTFSSFFHFRDSVQVFFNADFSLRRMNCASGRHRSSIKLAPISRACEVFIAKALSQLR